MAFNNKNPPWQRNAGMQAISMGFPQAQPVFNQNIGLQQQQNLSLIPQMGQIYSQTVQYPTSRQINTIAFQNQPQAQPSAQMGGQNASKFNPNQRVFSGTGHVTKVQNDFGFIDEEVFFHKNVCKGAFPKVGDRVLVEAAYNQNMPFKWNATRVQVLQSAASSSGGVGSSSTSRHNMGGGGGYNNSQLMSSGDRSGRNRYSPTRKSPDRHRSSNHDSRQRDVDDDDRRRRRDDRDGDRYREKHRDRTPDRERKEREKSPVRKQSPKRRKTRPIPRYMVQMPKQLLTQTRVDILELRRRYLTLYIPSDFFTSEVRWIEAFPPNEPFSINNPCAFHVMHKEVEPLVPVSANELEPADADYLYSAKVMLMATPPMAEFYQKCFATAEDRDRYEDLVHPTRLISFLVGIRGKGETMSIGGPWSPSLDGENPQSDPNVLIKTAIRTCKGLTGIDLSNCTRWYRFVELYYRRSETYHKGRLIPARIETVVIFLPDIRSCQPTRPEWDELHLSYKSHLEHIINSQSSDSPVPPAVAAAPSTEEPEPAASTVTADSPSPPAAAATAAEPAADEESTDKPVDTAPSSTSDSVKPSAEPAELAAARKEDAEDDKAADDVVEVTEKEEPEVVILDESDEEEPKKEPTPYTQLDVKKMKVPELRTELQARDLPTDGVKNVLVTRLTKALKEEQEEAEKTQAPETATGVAKSDDKPAADEETTAEEEKKPADEKSAEKDSANAAAPDDTAKPVEKEAEEDFETMDNVDMSEVTVIDEYDSKAEEKSKPEPVKLTEKERQLLEKRYSLPEQPHIIVHPSRTAKSGKFDCAVMSLSVLLDYRPEDSKEHSFEVSMFAELFNEMLTRDFGFNIYKALHMLPTKKEEEKKEKEVTIDLDAVDEKKVNGDGAKDKAGEEDTPKSTNDKDEKDKSKERDTRKRSRFDDPTEDERRRREKEKERAKFYTADRELLLSFTYFDVSHCGYIFEKDIEDLFYTIGLHLSRSQIRRLVSKAVTRDSLYYRKLTDKVKEDDDVVEITDEKSPEKEEKDADKAEADADEKKMEVEEKIDDAAAAATVEIPEAELKEIATGNSNYKEQLKANLLLVLNADAGEDDKPPAKKIKLDPTATEDGVPETESGIVAHNGAVVNIPKLLEQMRRLEKSREKAELLLVDLRKQNAELTRSNARANEKIKDQGTDLKNTAKKLAETEQNLREITRKYNEYFSTVSNIYDRVSLVLNRTESSSKRSSSITSSKRGSSRDRSSRKDTKPKDKEADPGKAKENNGADAAPKPSEKKSDDSSDVEVVAISDSKESIDTMDVDVASGQSDESAKAAVDEKEDAPEEAKEEAQKE